MSLLGLISSLGHALVSWGLGAPGEGAVEELPAIPCPTVTLAAAGHTMVTVSAAGNTAVSLVAAQHTVVDLEVGC